jgi:hypothetical protein
MYYHLGAAEMSRAGTDSYSLQLPAARSSITPQEKKEVSTCCSIIVPSENLLGGKVIVRCMCKL